MMNWRRWAVAVAAVTTAAAVGAGIAGGHALVAKARGGGDRAKAVGMLSLAVRGAGGRVVARRAGAAALAPSAGPELARLLAHGYTAGAWALSFVGPAIATLPGAPTPIGPSQPAGPCAGANGANIPCVLTPPNLSAFVGTAGEQADKLVLRGSFDVTGQGQATAVVASLELTCVDGSCPKSAKSLVQATLPSAITVSAGQKVLVTLVVGLQ